MQSEHSLNVPDTYVVVQFYWNPRFNLLFSLCFGMVMYDDESKTKGNKIKPRIKVNHSICIRYSYQDKHNYHYCVLYAMSILYLSQLSQLTFSALQT